MYLILLFCKLTTTILSFVGGSLLNILVYILWLAAQGLESLHEMAAACWCMSLSAAQPNVNSDAYRQ